GVGEGPLVLEHTVPLRGLLVFVAFDLLAGSFLAAYALGHAVAGGLIGLALAVGEGAALALGLQYGLFFPDRAASFMPLALLAAAAGVAAKAAAIPALSARFERARPLGLARGSATALLVAAGLLLSWSAEESAYARLRSSLRLVKTGLERSYFSILGEASPEEAQAALFPAVRDAGALASTVAGGLFWIAPDGRLVRLLPDGDGARFSLVGPYGSRVGSGALWDRDGRVLVRRDVHEPSGDRVEYWTGRP